MVVGRALNVCFACTLLMVGCAARNATGVHEVSVHQFVFGAFGGRALDLRDVCGGSAAQSFELRRSFSDYLVSVASLGMYVPHRVRVRCEDRTQ